MRTKIILGIGVLLLGALALSACDGDGGAAVGDTTTSDATGGADANGPADVAPLPDGAAPADTIALDGIADIPTAPDVPVEPDAPVAPDVPIEPDVPIVPDVSTLPDIPEETCDNDDLLDGLFGPIHSVSTGTVTAEVADGVHTLHIDATAGGSMGASANRPYTYVDLLGDQKVAVDDDGMRTSAEWHLGLKRSSIITNGGAQLPGAVEVAILQGVDFDSLTAVPGSADWWEEDFVDEEWCEALQSPIGGPSMAIGDPMDGLWYDYDAVSHALVPRARVYVLRMGDEAGTVVKMVIDNANDGGSLGRFVIRWAAL